jgi:hypothetical protein
LVAARAECGEISRVRNVWITIVILAISVVAWRQCAPVKHPAGVLARAEPEQIELTSPQDAITKNGWTLQPVALFSLDARVLGVKFYDDDDDISATIAPCDLMLGWGRMSDSAVLEKMDLKQTNRYYRWRFWGTGPISEREVITHSANMHIIPASDSILEELKSLRQGDLVRLSGNLVVATHPKGTRPWKTSLARDDVGEGACEVFYVKSLVVK